MGKRGKRKKDSNESGSDSCTQSRKKVNNERGPSGGDFSVSELLNQTNSILYENGNDSVFVPNLPTTTTTTTPIINRPPTWLQEIAKTRCLYHLGNHR